MAEATASSRGGPLSEVLVALVDGARSRDEVAARTGLSRDVVDAAVEHLVRMGRLNAESLAPGCPEQACGGCAAPTGTGCSTGGLVALTLTGRPPDA